MNEPKKGFNVGYDYSDFIKYGNKNHPKALRKVERKLARRKRRVLSKLVKEENVEREK